MTVELRLRNQSQQEYVRALSQAVRYGPQLYDTSLWLQREPELEEKMLREACIQHAVGFRQALIAGRQWNLVPKNENSPRAPLASFVGEQLLGKVKKFTEARRTLSQAFFSGSRFAKIHGRFEKCDLGIGGERDWWIPYRLQDEDKRYYRIVPHVDPDRGTVGGYWQRWNLAKQDWQTESEIDAVTTIRHVYNDTQNTLGYGTALRESLAHVWYSKVNIFQEMLMSIEKHAGGTLRAKIDGLRDSETGLPNETKLTQWLDKLEDMRGRHSIVHDKDDEIDLLPTNVEGWQIFKESIDHLDKMVLMLVLGSNLPTGADEGGSYALGGVQEDSREALIQYDRESLEETLTDDLVQCVWFKNHANMVALGIDADMPRFSITQEKKQDPTERAGVAQILNQMGVSLAAVDLYEQTGFRQPEQGEEIVEGSEPPPPMPGGFPGGGFPGQFSARDRSAYERFAEWEESKHPRDDDGKFGEGGGGGTGSGTKENPKAKKPKKGVPAGWRPTRPPDGTDTIAEDVPEPDEWFLSLGSAKNVNGDNVTSKSIRPVWDDLALNHLPEGSNDRDLRGISKPDAVKAQEAILEYADTIDDETGGLRWDLEDVSRRAAQTATKKWVEHDKLFRMMRFLAGDLDATGKGDSTEGPDVPYSATASYRVLSIVDKALASGTNLSAGDGRPFVRMGSDWQPYQGPKGGKGWIKGDTVIYQDEKPSDQEGAAEADGQPRQKGEAKPGASKPGKPDQEGAQAAPSLSLEDAQKYAAEKLGIKYASTHEGGDVHQNVLQSLTRLKQAGIPLPERVFVSSEEFSAYGEMASTIPAKFSPAFPDQITINPGATAWASKEAAAKMAADSFNEGWWSTADPAGTVVHEIGHMLHYRKSPERFMTNAKIGSDQGVRDEWEMAKYEMTGSELAIDLDEPSALAMISGYGQQDPNEFIAETYAKAKLDGNMKFDADWYEEYGGPDL